jgi:hypothetical protein
MNPVPANDNVRGIEIAAALLVSWNPRIETADAFVERRFPQASEAECDAAVAVLDQFLETKAAARRARELGLVC